MAQKWRACFRLPAHSRSARSKALGRATWPATLPYGSTLSRSTARSAETRGHRRRQTHLNVENLRELRLSLRRRDQHETARSTCRSQTSVRPWKQDHHQISAAISRIARQRMETSGTSGKPLTQARKGLRKGTIRIHGSRLSLPSYCASVNDPPFGVSMHLSFQVS